MRSVNHIKALFIWVFFLLLATNHGCILEDINIIEYGSFCDVDYIWNGEEACYEGECAGFDTYFNEHKCPKEYPICLQRGGESYCTSDCENQSHEYHYTDESGNEIVTCEKDSALHCGSHEKNCYEEEGNQGWSLAECSSNHQCKVLKCYDTHKLVGDLCVTLNECCGTDCKNCKRGGNLACYANECVDACPDGQIRCEGVCVDPRTSTKYCGATASCETNRQCGPGQDCVDSQCECGSGQAFCEDQCMDVTENLEHCGSCENNCIQMTGWIDGVCHEGKCQASQCAEGTHKVNKDGAVLCETDAPTACGSADNDCTKKSGWADGYCDKTNCVLTECVPKFFVHNNECMANSDDNCGAYGKKCQPGHKCDLDSGGCLCENGLIECDGGCVDIQNSESHCGSCGHACDVSNAENECSGGECSFKCYSNYVKTADGSGCEPFVCNHGEKKCAGDKILVCQFNKWEVETECSTSKEHAVAICKENGSPQCAEECITGYQDCGGVCVDVMHDITNCLSCGTVCGGVSNGYPTCTATGCSFECNGNYIKSGSGCELKICNEGTHQCVGKEYQTCHNNQWETTITCTNPSHGVSNCNSDYAAGCVMNCDPGYTLCGDQCVDTQNDSYNCGGCNNYCATGCKGGVCGCSGGQVDCGGQCVSSQAQGIVGAYASVISASGGGSLGGLDKNTVVDLYGTDGSNYVIRYGGSKAYVSKRDVYILPAFGNVTASNGVRIRECAGTSCNTIDYTATYGKKLTILGYENGWYYVKCYSQENCSKGYASADWVELNGGSDTSLRTCN